MSEDSPEIGIVAQRGALALLWAERLIFFLIGVAMFAAAAIMLVRSVAVIVSMLSSTDSIFTDGARFLDLILLVLMIVELAYTVTLSLRGEVLLAEPFLIVGLIAVIRRMLVITVGSGETQHAGVTASIPELGMLTGIVLVFVFSIYLLRSRPLPDKLGRKLPRQSSSAPRATE
jgi:uncharacterized membrane protein (DUF373 family)